MIHLLGAFAKWNRAGQLLLLPLLMSYLFTHAQTPDEDDRYFIRLEAQGIVEDYGAYLNEIATVTNPYRANKTIELCIERLFASIDAIVEDNVDPRHWAENTPDLSVKQYLLDLHLNYVKGIDSAITLTDFQVSPVKMQAEEAFVKVRFRSEFRSHHKDITLAYQPQQRVAEVRAIRENRRWKLQIVSIRFLGKQDDQEFQDLASLPQEETVDLPDEAELATARKWVEMGEYERAKALFEEVYSFYPSEEIQQQIDSLEDRIRIIRVRQSYADIYEYSNNIQQERTNPDLYYERAVLHLKQNNLTAALDDCRQALKLQPAYRKAHVMMGDLYRRQNRPQEALTSYGEALELIDRDPQVWLAMAAIKNETGAYKEAIEDVNFALVFSPEEAPLYHERGRAYLQQRDWGRARDDFDHAIAIQPTPESYYLRALTVSELEEDPDQVLADLKQAVRLRPEYRQCYLMMGDIYLAKGDEDAAVQAFQKAVEQEEYSPEIYLKMARAYLNNYRYEAAEAWADKAVDAFDYMSEALYIRGVARAFSDQERDAALDFNKVIKLKRGFVGESYYQLANVYKSYFRAYSKANQYFQKALQKKPALLKQPEVLLNMGENDLYLNREESAKNRFEGGMALNPTQEEEASLRYGLGLVHIIEGDKRKAFEFFESAFEFGEVKRWEYLEQKYLRKDIRFQQLVEKPK